MIRNKTATLTIRVEPRIKESLKAAAERERRSIANMVEILIRDYCERNGVSMAESNKWLAIKETDKVK